MVERVEIITRTERRRRWSDDEKRRLVGEAFRPGAIVAQVARHHGVAESCLYTWRKRFIDNVAGRPAVPDHPRLIPVMIEAAPATRPTPAPMRTEAPRAIITLPDGTRVEIAAGYPVSAVRAVIAALRQVR